MATVNSMDETRTILDFCPNLLCVTDRDCRFRFLNAAWFEQLGWTAEELQAGPWIELVHGDDKQKTRDAIWELAGVPLITRLENRFRHKDSSYHRLSWTVLQEKARASGFTCR